MYRELTVAVATIVSLDTTEEVCFNAGRFDEFIGQHKKLVGQLYNDTYNLSKQYLCMSLEQLLARLIEATCDAYG